ncbi:MAG: class I SAM-dependent methyltransferase [Bacteroidaceae bacterium]|nr:class I SAM-dependent methyltransferase [Bacteroidaceae bacterium]
MMEDYIKAHIDPEPDYLHRLYRDTQLRLSYGQMASGHVQGRLLKMLTQMIRPRTVVELGTFSGYSALCIAEGLEPGAVVHTFEIYDEQEDFTRPWLEQSDYADRIRFHIGDALQLLPQMDLRPDMAFVDADKRHYVEYYEMLLPMMPPGGYIVADNTLWYGHVLETETRESDLQTLGIKAFNDLLAHDDRVEKVIVPVRDGLTLIRKK